MRDFKRLTVDTYSSTIRPLFRNERSLIRFEKLIKVCFDVMSTLLYKQLNFPERDPKMPSIDQANFLGDLILALECPGQLILELLVF